MMKSQILYCPVAFSRFCGLGKDINMYINSPGGSVYAGLGVYDTLQYVSPDVPRFVSVWLPQWPVYCWAQVPRKTSCFKTFTDHDASAEWRYRGQASDIEITVKEIRKLKSELYEIVNFHSGKPVSEIERILTEIIG
jgi:ATP-dependent Clp protease protease subunit